MKSFLLMTAAVLFGFSISAQAPLDVYNTFAVTAPPQGWSYHQNINAGDLYYIGGSDFSPSFRLDATGEYALVEMAESAASVSYFVRSTGFTPPVAPGTVFSVQESTDGLIWNDLRTLDENNLTGDFTFFSDTPDPMSRFIRFYYTNKASGSNMALDEVTIIKAPAAPSARLMIYRNELKVLSGHSAVFSSADDLLLELLNEGLEQTLQVDEITITGPDAAVFSISPSPSSVAPQQSQSLVVSVDGEEGEVYEAELSITTNDAFHPIYKIQLFAHGGTFASEPNVNPTNLTADNIRTYGFDLNWNPAAVTPNRYLILQNSTGAIDLPQDGTDYDISEYIGTSRVIFNDLATHFSPHNIAASTTYHYFIYSVNGTGNYCNYQQIDPLTLTVATPDHLAGDYYNGLNSNATDFVQELSDLIFQHTTLSYYDYPDYLIAEFETRDTTQERKAVTGYYSNYHYLYQGPFYWEVLSREHVFAHSWYSTFPAFDALEYADYHNLFPAHNDSSNVVRSNHPFGEVATVHRQFLEGKIGWNSNGQYVYEPRDFAKGRVARAIFYMLTSYNNQIGGAWALPTNQSQELLKGWHFSYPPDGREMARNDYIFSIQHNRNPFIDSVHFACRIDFETMMYIQNPDGECGSVGVQEQQWGDVLAFPNPSNGNFTLRSSNRSFSNSHVAVFDLNGRKVYQQHIAGLTNEVSIDLSHLSSGVYLLNWSIDEHLEYIRLVIR